MGRGSRKGGGGGGGSLRGGDPLLGPEEMLEEIGVPEEYIEGFQRARSHLSNISSDPSKAREAEVVRTQILSSYLNIAENYDPDMSPEAAAFIKEVNELAAPLLEEARELAQNCDTSEWSEQEFLFYRLYAQARRSFDKIDSRNADIIRDYLAEENKGQDPLLGGQQFSAVDYRRQALLLHGACLIEEDPVLRKMDADLRRREEEARQRASVEGRITDVPIISLPRAEWSTSIGEGGIAPGWVAPVMLPEEADDLLMDQTTGTLGFTSSSNDGSPVFVLLGAIEEMRQRGKEHDPTEIAIHELIHTLQPNGFESQRAMRESLREEGIDTNRSANLHTSWLEANTELLRILRGNPGLAENLDKLPEVQFAYREEVFAMAEVLESLPAGERLRWVEKFNALGPAGSMRALEGHIENPLSTWDNLARRAAAEKSK